MILSLSLVTLVLAGIVIASVGGNRDIRRRDLGVRQSLEPVQCSDDTEAQFISDSYYEAMNLANIALNYMYAGGDNDPLVVAYWGSGNSLTTTVWVYKQVIGLAASSLTLSCSDPNNMCANNVPAYNDYPSNPNSYVYYCSSFYIQNPTSDMCDGSEIDPDNVRGGTTLQQVGTLATYPYWGLIEVSGGCSEALQLASSGDSRVNTNVYNYSCFALQAYNATQCVSD